MNAGTKMAWFLLAALALAAVLWPAQAAAQAEKKDFILRFSPGSYPYDINIGQDNIFYLEIENSGTLEISSIRLSANVPEGWVVAISPDTVNNLVPGKFQTFDVRIRPAATADKRDYQITFVAEGDGVRKVMTAWVRVQGTSSVWLWVGIGTGVLVVAGFILVFLRIGRQ